MRLLTLTLAALAVAVSASNPLDPFPSLRSVGDTVYTKYSALLTNITGNGTKAAAAAAASAAAHAATNAVHAAKSPAGNVTYGAFHAIDNILLNKTAAATCNPAVKKPVEVIAIDGSGLLLPYYQGIVQALQDRGVITPANLASIKFGGLSGGAITSVLTALGWSGRKQFAFLGAVLQAVAACGGGPACTLNALAIPILASMLPPDAAATVSKRVTIWACQVNPLATTIANSVAMGTSSWADNADLLANVRVTDQIPCFSFDTIYSIFRGAPYIDGGYCADYAQLCAVSKDKCLKISSTFMGPWAPEPPKSACDAVVEPNYLPNPGKPYYVPSDRSAWTLPQGAGQCANAGQPGSAYQTTAVDTTPFVAQGVTAKPDIHPAFYAPLPPVFPDACSWLTSSSTVAPQPLGGQRVQAMFDHGYASGAGWANANGYCA